MRVFWESYGAGEQTILCLPTWTLVHSRVWKAQIAYFARHFRVLCFDPRGNGRSDRPQDEAAYAEAEFAQDAVDVMDACSVDRAICVGLSTGAQRGLLLAAEHPERVAGMVLVGPWFPVSPLRSLRWRVLAHLRMARFRTGGRSRRAVGASSTPTTGRTAAMPTSSSGGRRGRCPSRTRPSRSRTRSRGRTKPTG